MLIARRQQNSESWPLSSLISFPSAQLVKVVLGAADLTRQHILFRPARSIASPHYAVAPCRRRDRGHIRPGAALTKTGQRQRSTRSSKNTHYLRRRQQSHVSRSLLAMPYKIYRFLDTKTAQFHQAKCHHSHRNSLLEADAPINTVPPLYQHIVPATIYII